MSDARPVAQRPDPALQPAAPLPGAPASLPSTQAGEPGAAIAEAGDNIGIRPSPAHPVRRPQPARTRNRATKTSAG